MSFLLVAQRGFTFPGRPWLTDPDARDFIQRVEAADGAALEDGIKLAYADFIRGCKADGIWNAIKASCILAGARTLSGALVPLVGTAPTNFNFVSGDYDRKTGLVGNGSTKYLNSNRNNNAEPQNSKHLSVYASTAATSGSTGFYPAYIGGGSANTGASGFGRLQLNGNLFFQVNQAAANEPIGTGPSTGFIGATRNNSASITYRVSGSSASATRSSNTPRSVNLCIFRDLDYADSHTNARLAFYSIGESIDLALLDARVTTLINAIGAAIP